MTGTQRERERGREGGLDWIGAAHIKLSSNWLDVFHPSLEDNAPGKNGDVTPSTIYIYICVCIEDRVDGASDGQIPPQQERLQTLIAPNSA